MTAIQLARDVVVAYKNQAVLGTPESGAGAKVFRINGGGGMNLNITKIRSNENRRDGQSTRGRHGTQHVAGNYVGDASLGTFNDFMEAVVRGTWSAALVITGSSSVTGVTFTGANTIHAAAGSWLTEGLKLYDTIVLTAGTTAGNLNKPFRIVALTASDIQVAEVLTNNAVNDTTFSLRRGLKLINPAVPVRRIFTIEENEYDQDASQVFQDVRVGSMKVTKQANNMVLLDFGVMGRKVVIAEGAAAPNFTTPTESTTQGLVAVDSVVRLGGADLVTLSTCDFTLNLNPSIYPVIGSLYSPDVFENNMQPIAGTITALRSDMTLLKNAINEDTLSLHLLCIDPAGAAPHGYLSFSLENLTLDNNTKNIGQDGPLVQTIPFEAGKVLAPATNQDGTMIKILSSV